MENILHNSRYRCPTYFPHQFERNFYRFKNAIHNRLYPIPPLLFSIAFALIASLLYRNPPKHKFPVIFAGIFPEQITFIFNILLVAFLSTYLPVALLRFILRHFYFGYKKFIFEKKENQSVRTKVWFIFQRLFNRLAPQLYSCEGLLPTLPLPSLKGTITKYLSSVEPLLSPEEFTNVKEMAENFLKNEGWKLQGFARLYWCFASNYVTNIWEKFAYHYSRKGLLINTSVAHLDVFAIIPANQAVRAAHVAWLETMSMLSIDRQSLRPVAGGVISLSHLWKCYATTRVPGEVVDHLEVYTGRSRHIVVQSRGCIYKLDVFDEDGRIFNLDELTEIFSELLTRDENVEEVEGRIAALTTDARDQWYLNRRRFFLENATNRASLAIIESAIFYLILDDANYNSGPEGLEIFLKNMLTGDGSNRWADKSLNYIISTNGRGGGTIEHSVADGAEFSYIFENYLSSDFFNTHYVFFFLQQYPEKVEQVVRPDNLSETKKYAIRLNFDVSEQMKAEIIRCYISYQEQINDVDIACLVFDDFGKGFIKKAHVSPDAFVQMALQLACFRDQGKFFLTYESISARFFANSRTETLRPVTKQSCAFVIAMIDANSNDEERLKLFYEATEAHVFHSKECLTGSGVDRHLFVLYILSKITGINSPLLNYYIAQPWELSTSQTPNVTNQIDEDKHPNFSWFGGAFQAPSKNGYGVSYRFAGNHSICINIACHKSAKNTDSHRFRQHLIQSIHDISAILKS